MLRYLHFYKKEDSRAFTLIELLVVIAIIAILAVVVVLTLNPLNLLAQSRDANRVSDLATLNTAVNLYITDQGSASSFFLGNSTTTYISIPDPAATSSIGTGCGTLSGMPATSTGWYYHCPATSTFRATAGNGWLPVNFSTLSAGVPFSVLPADPANNLSSLLYYNYIASSTQYEVSVPLESQKYLKQYLLGGNADPARIIAGTAPTLILPEEGLSEYWNLDEGQGTAFSDSGALGHNGSLLGTTTPAWYSSSNCKVGTSCLGFSNGYGQVNSSASGLVLNGGFSIMAWVNPSSTPAGLQIFMSYGLPYFGINTGKGQFSANINGAQINDSGVITIPVGTWSFLAGTYDGTNMNLYVNGVLDTQKATSGPATVGNTFYLGNHPGLAWQYPGLLDDVRFYNYPLSAAQISAIYNAER